MPPHLGDMHLHPCDPGRSSAAGWDPSNDRRDAGQRGDRMSLPTAFIGWVTPTVDRGPAGSRSSLPPVRTEGTLRVTGGGYWMVAINCWIIWLLVVSTREEAEKPVEALIRLMNSCDRSTLDSSRAEPTRVPAPPLPGVWT